MSKLSKLLRLNEVDRMKNDQLVKIKGGAPGESCNAGSCGGDYEACVVNLIKVMQKRNPHNCLL